MRRWLPWSALALFLLACATAALLATTEWGLRWTVARLAGAVPGELSITAVHGSLIGPIRIEGLVYRQSDGATVSVQSAALEWRPLSLLSGTFNITHIDVQGVRYTPPTVATTRSPTVDLPDITLPLQVNLRRAALKDLTIEQPGGNLLSVSSISLTASSDRHAIHVADLTLSAPLMDLSVHGSVRPQGAYAMEWHARWSARPPNVATIAGTLDVTGSLRDLQVSQYVTRPFRADITGRVTDVTDHPAWNARVALQALDTRALRGDFPPAAVSGDMELHGDSAGLTARGGLSVTGTTVPFTARFDLSYKDATIDVSRLRLTSPAAAAILTAGGRITRLDTTPRVDAKGTWSKLTWPLTADTAPAVASDSGSFEIHGTADDYHLALGAAVSRTGLPQGDLHLTAQGDRDALHVTEVRLATLDGKLTAHGSLAWRPRLTWQFSVAGAGLNPGDYWTQYSGTLGFIASSDGKLSEEGPQMRVTFQHLAGTIRGYPVSGDASITYDGSRLEVNTLALSSAETRVSASGTVGKKWDLQWRVVSPSLEALLPDAHGTLNADGRVSGDYPRPRVVAAITGKHLAYKQYRADTLSVQADVDVTATRQSRLTATLERPAIGEAAADFFRFTAEGTRDEHHAEAAVHTDAGVLSVALGGGYADGAWRGTLNQLDLISRNSGYWHLKAPASLTVSPEGIQVDEACWRRDKAHICGRGHWHRGGDWQGEVNARRVPLRWLRHLSMQGIDLSGHLDASLSMQQQTGTLTGQADINLNDAAVQATLPDGDQVKFRMTHSVFKARTQNQQIIASLNMDLPDRGSLQGSLTLPVTALPLPGFTGPEGAPLKGRLSARITDLALLPRFIPTVDNTRGTLTAVVDIDGTVTNPAFTGHAELDNGAMTIPALGLQVTEISLVARSDNGTHFTLEVQARSGGGSIRVNSSGRLSALADQMITLTISSDRFEVVKIPEAWVLVTSELTLQVSATSVELSGNIFIPEAKLSPRDLSTAVRVSNDTQIVNGSVAETQTATRTLHGLVNIQLGDKVYFEGFGLSAQVQGNLAVQQDPRQPAVGYGTVNVTGEYKAYGQRLSIEQGRLAFVGTPVDNPGLDIKAVRKIDTVTAGINVLGTLKKPRFTIFSDPAMDDADALSYLIIGRPINQDTSQEGQRLAGAATALGLTGGEFLAKKIGHIFGIQQVNVETSPDTQNPSLVLGTYLSPQLYVSYGFGLVEAVSTLQLRYQINEKWSVEAESGLYSGADILYSIETH
jgi:translocation and assembly module TamB